MFGKTAARALLLEPHDLLVRLCAAVPPREARSPACSPSMASGHSPLPHSGPTYRGPSSRCRSIGERRAERVRGLCETVPARTCVRETVKRPPSLATPQNFNQVLSTTTFDCSALPSGLCSPSHSAAWSRPAVAPNCSSFGLGARSFPVRYAAPFGFLRPRPRHRFAHGKLPRSRRARIQTARC